MSETILDEAFLLAGSLLVGVGLMILYDVLRIFRILICHSALWTGIEDVIYWMICGMVTFLLLFRLNDGILRWYAVGGVLAGMLTYNLTVSQNLLRLLKKIKKYFTIKTSGKMEDRKDAGGRKSQKKEKENLNNRMALVGITLVVLSLAIAVHMKGNDLKQKDLNYQIREENLQAQVQAEEERSAELENYRVYVQTKEYIEKIAKEKLGLVNEDEVLLKPAEKK